jgi:predicted O-methyltransferase YrrM
MKGVKTFAQRILGPSLKALARRKVKRLRNSDVPQALVKALSGWLDGSLSDEEAAWVDRIESLRTRLNSADVPAHCASCLDKGDLDAANEHTAGLSLSEIADICRTASRPPFWSLLLFKVIREFKPVHCIELGTCLGISGAYQGAALVLNRQGRLVTVEGEPSRASLAKMNFQLLGLDNISVVMGRFEQVLDEALAEDHPVDYAFIDGHHDEQATIAYFETIRRFVSERSIFVFDDIRWSDGMRRAWQYIQAAPEVKISLDLRAMGVCILDRGIPRQPSSSIPLV